MEKLIKQYNELQDIYGSKELNSVYGGGCDKNPKVALVFMNPTKRNIATSKSWEGLKVQFLGTKQVWEFLTKCELFDAGLNDEIKSKKSMDWTREFCERVYAEVEKQGLWITNLAKCTQDDARPLPDEVFMQYKDLLKEELKLVNPKKIFFFGNQVASIVLDEKITVSTTRQKKFDLNIDGKIYDSYAIFYPIGNGGFNQPKAVDDIKEILTKGK